MIPTTFEVVEVKANLAKLKHQLEPDYVAEWWERWWAHYIYWVIKQSDEPLSFRPTEDTAFRNIATEAKLAEDIRLGYI